MTVTYHHNAAGIDNPHPLTHDALASVGTALEAAARGDGPLTRAIEGHPNNANVGNPIQIMGAKLSPSPELHGAGAGTLEVDYQDGTTRTFDVDAMGALTPRKYAYAMAVVIETDEPLPSPLELDDWETRVLDHAGNMLPSGFPGSVEFASTPKPCEYRPHDDYDVQPRDDSRGRP
jgi:hypothetical protein